METTETTLVPFSDLERGAHFKSGGSRVYEKVDAVRGRQVSPQPQQYARFDGFEVQPTPPPASPQPTTEQIIEACARICESRASSLHEHGSITAGGEAHKCAMAIRAGWARSLDRMQQDDDEQNHN